MLYFAMSPKVTKITYSYILTELSSKKYVSYNFSCNITPNHILEFP